MLSLLCLSQTLDCMKADIFQDISIELKSIELEEVEMRVSPKSGEQEIDIEFRMSNQLKINREQNHVIVLTKIDTSSDILPNIRAQFVIRYVFAAQGISGLELDNQGEKNLADYFKDKLQQVVVSTTRGIMFSTLKGTLLQHAILPYNMGVGQNSES